jgi:PAS domain S-box-containing protein
LKADGTITFFNEYAQVFFGYTEEEAIGKHVSILVPEKEFTGADSTALVRDAASVPGRSVNNIDENICRDGSRVWMAWTDKAILDESGKVTEILSVGTDITERKKAEEQVRVTLESIADGFIAFNADWQFIYVNAAAERLLGVSRTEALGRSIWEVFTLIPGTQVERELRRAAAGEVREFEYFYELWGLWFHSRYYPREGGGISVYFKDITGRKLAEAALRESRAKLEAALASMTDVVLISDGEVRLIEFNDAFATWHHRVTSRDLHSNILVEYCDILDMFLPNGEPAPLEMWPIQRALRGEVARDAEYTLRSRETGESWIVSFSSSPIRDQDGGIVGAVLVGRDISERKRVEEDLRNSEKELRFLSSRLLSAQEEERRRVAGELHDSLGSSLTAIKIGLENTRSKIDKGDAGPELLDNPIVWTQHAINEIRRLMTELRPAILDDMGIIAALQWFFRQYRTTYPEIHVEPEVRIEEHDVPETLRIVIFRITQEAFHNIAKHSRAEYVDFSLVRQDSGIELTIGDNGTGFDLEAVLSKTGERQGLGLTSMKERAELSGGSFAIRSVPETGTVLSVIWPLISPAVREAVGDRCS